jgi:hypothetical protein
VSYLGVEIKCKSLIYKPLNSHSATYNNNTVAVTIPHPKRLLRGGRFGFSGFNSEAAAR